MLHQRMFESGTYKSLLEHIALYEPLEASMARAQRDEFLAEMDKSRKRCRDDQDPPHPPPDSDLSKRRRHDTNASGSSQPQAPQSSAWKKSVTRDAPLSSSKQQSGPHAEQPVEDIPILDSANISDSEDTDSAHLLKIKQRPEWSKPILDDERPATLEPAWVIPTSHIPNAKNNWANALASMYQALAEKSLLEKTGDMRTFMNCCKVVRTHMCILNVVGIKAYSRYGYDYLKEITLRRADCQEYTIAEKDFKNLYPSDFEDMNMLILQGEDLQLGIESYQKQLNLTKPGWDAMGYEYKHDYTIIESPCAVVFPVSNNERKIIRFNEVYKLSDGTLTNILEVMHYKVRRVQFNRSIRLGDSDVNTLKDPTLTLEILSRRFFLRLNLPDHRSLNPFLEDYIELNDLNEPFQLRRNQRDDLMPTIEEGEVIEEFRNRDKDLDIGINDYPSYCDGDKKIHIDCTHNLKFSCMIGFEFTHVNFFPLFFEDMDAYRDKGMGNIIIGEPFLREVRFKTKRFEGIITLYNDDDEVNYQMVRSHPRFKNHTNEQCNKIPPLLKVSEKDMKNGISHAYQKLNGFYKGVLNLRPNYIRNAKTEEWLTRGHISVHETK
ncbi:hypothetical protein Tco_1230062 [Tanacetum coccineum]